MLYKELGCGEDKNMLLTFDVDNNKVVVHHTGKLGSEYIKGLLSDLGDDVVITIPDKFITVVTYYFEYLIYGKHKTVNNKHDMKLCLDMYTYFIDESYLNYVMKQLLNNWSSGMSTMVYDDINYTLQWEIFLHCPLDFIPKVFLTNKVFRNKWDQTNNGGIIHANGNEVYYNNQSLIINGIDGYKKTYHTKGDKPEAGGYAREVGTAYLLGPGYGGEYLDGNKHGWEKYWYILSGNKGREGKYINGNKHGVWREYYDNKQNTVMNEYHYNNGLMTGPHKEYFQHGIHVEGNYNDNKRDGMWTTWNLNGSIWSQCSYKNGDKHGMWKYWYNNHNHTLEQEGQYVNNVQHGTWKKWYDDLAHTLERESHYDHGKPTGTWITYSQDGIIINVQEFS